MTLVEIMIAATISLILLAGVLQIFVSNKRTYQLNEAMSRLQENARFALDVLTSDIRMAGFIGCMGSNNPSNFESILADPTAYEFDLSNLLTGYDYTGSGWTPALDSSFASDVVAGTDVIAMKHLSGDGVPLVSPYSDSAQLFVDPAAASALNEGEILMVTDCTQGSVFQVTNLQESGGKLNVVHSNGGGFVPGNAAPAIFSNSYGADAKLAKLVSTVYYIGTGASGEPALFRRGLNRDTGTIAFEAHELVEGVENMQILYGEVTGGSTKFVTANNVTDMDNVVAIRVALLMKTVGDLGEVAASADTDTYDLLGETVDPSNDRVIRRVVSTTINIRNRGL